MFEEFISKIKECNNFCRESVYPFFVGDVRVGWIKREHCQALFMFPEVFVINNERILLSERLSTYDIRTQALSDVVAMLRKEKKIPMWQGEIYDVVHAYGEEPIFALDRGAITFFGARSYGTHLNGYTYRNGELYIWVAKRASHLEFAPNKLDNIAAGGMPRGVTPIENIIKEAKEEAQLSHKHVSKAEYKGEVSYLLETPLGVMPDSMFIFDLEIPKNVVPETDGEEISEFLLLSVDEVYNLVKTTSDFKYNSALVMIDFMIRHNIINEKEPNYSELKKGLSVSFDIE